MARSWAERYGTWAVVTGASSGIGEQFARQLGARGLNLLLVARRLDRLQRVADEIAAAHGCEVRVAGCDLGTENFLDALRPHCDDLDIGLLVNNAGFTNTGPLVDNDLERELQLLHVNCRAYLVLAHHLGARMKARGRGGIVFVSSTTAFAPAALWANYAASKAYELALGEAMHTELRPHGVDVVVVCPGPSPTGFYATAGQDLGRMPKANRFLLVEPAQIAAEALDALGRRRSIVAGWGNKLLAQVGRLAPRSFLASKVTEFVESVSTTDEPG